MSEELEEKVKNIIKLVDNGVKKGLLHCSTIGYEKRPCAAFGIPSLDNVLNGGIPLGTMVDLFGSEGSGKCVTKDTYLYTEEGLVTLEEMFEKNNKKCTNSSKIEDSAYPVLDEKGELENTTHFTWNGSLPVTRIKTSSGFELECTARHPIRILNKNGFVIWKNIEDVELGDFVVIQKGMQIFSENTELDIDDGILLGLFIAEGHIKEWSLQFSNTDQSYVDLFTGLVAKKFGVTNFKNYPKEHPKTKRICHNIRFGSKELVLNFITKYGLSSKLRSGTMHVPYCLRTSSKEVQRQFLKYYYLGEGHACRAKLEISSKSKLLLRQVQYMLLNFNCYSSLSIKEINNTLYYRLHIGGAELKKFKKIIGYDGHIKGKFLDTDFKVYTQGIPNTSWMGQIIQQDCINSDRKLNKVLCNNSNTMFTKKKLDELYQIKDNYNFGPSAIAVMEYLNFIYTKRNWKYTKVTNIEKLGRKPTFDISKPSHTFWSNGLVSHNTTLALHLLANRVSNNKVVMIVDAECKLDPRLAKNIGVDLTLYPFCQPTTAEEAFEIIEHACQGLGEGDAILVDSAAALTPKDQIEGDMDKDYYGGNSKTINKGLRKILAPVAQKKCVVVFINQLRDTMYGVKTTPCGRALRHHCSTRIEVTRTGWIKDHNQRIIGQNVKVEAAKSGHSDPKQPVALELYFGFGFDKYSSAIDLAVTHDIIKKAASWYTWGEQKTQGTNGMKEYLNTEDNYNKLLKELQEKGVEVGL